MRTNLMLCEDIRNLLLEGDLATFTKQGESSQKDLVTQVIEQVAIASRDVAKRELQNSGLPPTEIQNFAYLLMQEVTKIAEGRWADLARTRFNSIKGSPDPTETNAAYNKLKQG